MSLYSSPEAKQRILNIYQEKLDELAIDYRYESVPTTFGDTNVVVTGDAANPPLVLIHGSNGCAPIALDIYPNFRKRYQVFAVDVIAQPNRSAETRPTMKDDSYGQWMNEVLEKLKLQEVTIVGFSFGGFVIMKQLVFDESRIKKAFLICPVGIVNGNPLKLIWNVFIPMRRYMSNGKEKHLDDFLNTTFSDPDPFAKKFLPEVLKHFEMDFSPLPTLSKVNAAKITTPLTIIGAEKDMMFPGKKLLKRAKQIFPSLSENVLLPNSKHVQTRADNLKIEEMILNAIA